MSQVNDAFSAVRESVSTIFRHILPGILIIVVGEISIPSSVPQLSFDNIPSIIMVFSIAMVIGNVWYVFHRYCILQFVDFLAYYFKCNGQPSRVGKSDYRGDLAQHVSKYFSSSNSGMGKHIRDRFSSFNFMYIVSEVFIIFTIISEDASFLHKYYWLVIALGFLGLVAATWQYLIVRVIDAKFVLQYHKNGSQENPGRDSAG
jgi:hypothetical protein